MLILVSKIEYTINKRRRYAPRLACFMVHCACALRVPWDGLLAFLTKSVIVLQLQQINSRFNTNCFTISNVRYYS